MAPGHFDRLGVAFEVVIPGHEVSRFATNSRFENFVVIGVTADLEVARDLDDRGSCCDELDECFRVPAWIFESSGQSRAVKDVGDLGELWKGCYRAEIAAPPARNDLPGRAGGL